MVANGDGLSFLIPDVNLKWGLRTFHASFGDLEVFGVSYSGN